jgi:hypothetical protein
VDASLSSGISGKRWWKHRRFCFFCRLFHLRFLSDPLPEELTKADQFRAGHGGRGSGLGSGYFDHGGFP